MALTFVMCLVSASTSEAEPDTPSTPPSEPDQESDREPDREPEESESADGTPMPPADGMEQRPSARQVASAPKPHETRGLAKADPSEKPGRARIAGRLLLTVPRWAFSLAMQPIRASAWAYDRYQLQDRFRRIFFNETETMGLFPAFFFETGFGFNAGLRFIYRDLFGKRESLRVRTGWGGRYRQRYAVTANTGDRLGSLRIELAGTIEVRDRERFAGIGNRDLATGALISPIDALGDGPVLESRYRQRFGQLSAATRVSIAGPLAIRATGGVLDRKFSTRGVNARNDPVISEAYDTSSIPGFTEDPQLGYAELELSFIDRRPASKYMPWIWWTTGSSLRAFAGHARSLRGDPSRFYRFGVDLQRYINLFDNSRVLVVRGYGEGVSEPPGERVPFSELPSLGGRRILRGYPKSRFRDRYAAMGSLEYQFDVNSGSYGYLFMDAGKVMRTMDAVSLDELRLGFGGGLQLNTTNSRLARILIAGTADGDFLLSLSFAPQFDPPHRFGRI
jgi:hypothetical protein